jgi:hypothetical protein
MVMDGTGDYSIPIKVYSDSDVEVFIPDITAPAWISWSKDEFKAKGTYHTYFYAHFKNDRMCRRSYKNNPKYFAFCSVLRYERKLILVDTRNKTVTFFETILMERDARYNPNNQTREHVVGSFTALDKPTYQAIKRTTAIIAEEVRKVANTPSAQDINRRNDEISNRMYDSAREQKPLIEINCERDCYEGSMNYHGLHLYSADDCRRECPSSEVRESQQTVVPENQLSTGKKKTPNEMSCDLNCDGGLYQNSHVYDDAFCANVCPSWKGRESHRAVVPANPLGQEPVQPNVLPGYKMAPSPPNLPPNFSNSQQKEDGNGD